MIINIDFFPVIFALIFYDYLYEYSIDKKNIKLKRVVVDVCDIIIDMVMCF